MPLGINIKHINRSQQALDNSLAQAQIQRGLSINQPQPQPATAIGPGDEDKVYEARNTQPPPYPNPRSEAPTYLATNNEQEVDSRAYQESADRPSRSQSHRVGTSYPHLQPLSAVGEPRGAVDDQALTEYGRPYNTGPAPKPQPQQPAAEQKKIKSRSFFGFQSKNNRTAEQPPIAEQQSSYNNLSGLSRRISSRHKEPQPVFQSQAQNTSNDKQHQLPGWQSGHSSESQLPSPNEVEEGESGASRYIIHQSDKELDRLQDPTRDQLPNPTIRVGGGDQEPTIRLVDESWHQQFQQQPSQIVTQQQWIAQQSQQVAHSPVPLSPDGQQQTEYQSNPHPGQYQTHPILSNPIPPNAQFRSSTNPEVVSQLSYDSPVEVGEDQRPVSGHSNNQTSTAPGIYSSHLHSDYPARITSIQRPPGQQSTMPPPPAPTGSNRRSTDTKQVLQPDSRNNGPPPSYSQQQFPGPSQGLAAGQGNPLPPPPPAQQPANYRGSALQREYGQPSGTGEQGRSTPPLPGERDRELTEMDKLVIKYKKVKGLYFDRQAQVEQLQNTLANQRLSQSRTSLDDSEYATRFNRLDGAIKEIAFSIRKDWKSIPRWLIPYVNQDAQKIGTKEMTAVGRATISRWINDEIFSKCFHPGLEIGLSSELKRIEQNIRLFASPATNQEESDMLTSKVVQWRLSTVEGLGYMLNSTESQEAKAMFTQMSVSNLTAHLIQHLQEPPPQGIEGNATSIIELAIGIACHLPLESRDISIVYPLPGETVLQSFKVEAPLPPLENPGPDPSADADGGSIQSDSKDQNSEADAGKGESSGQKISKKPQDKGKIVPQLQAQNSTNGKKMPTNTAGAGEPGQEKGKDRGDGPQKIRFSGFVGVEVRGRQWLVNSPVWTM